MSMSAWAERANSESPDEWDYGVACYKSALKAYKSLMEDGHSGCSFGLTKNILIRLMDGLPLTPIEDTPDIWNQTGRTDTETGITTYQCKRMSSLFKDVSPDGTVEYHDVNRFCCVDVDNLSAIYYNGFISRNLQQVFPITMPYIPEKPYRVVCEDFLLDPKNGDYDHKAILHVIKPNGETVMVNRFFKESGDSFIEIPATEYYNNRITAHFANKKENKDA